MKNIFFLIFLFVSSEVLCQIKSGSIEYSVTFTKDKELETGMLANYYKDAKNNAKFLSYLLDFDDKRMVFYVNEKLKSDSSENLDFVEAFSDANGKYFREKNSSLIFMYIRNCSYFCIFV